MMATMCRVCAIAELLWNEKGLAMNDGFNSLDPAIEGAWEAFLIDVALASHYHLPHTLDTGGAERNIIVDRLLPSLLYLKMVTVLDEALDAHLTRNGVQLTRPYRDDLNGRINYLRDNGRLPHAVELHRIRQTRNDIAHTQLREVPWGELEADILPTHAALAHLGFVGDRPEFTVEGERKPDGSPPPPGIEYVVKYTITVKSRGVRRAEWTWSKQILR